MGYANDVAMIEDMPEALAERLTTIADDVIEETDMYVKLKKTFSQIVGEQEPVAEETPAEINEVE